jgi:hypothetical protein
MEEGLDFRVFRVKYKKLRWEKQAKTKVNRAFIAFQRKMLL